MKKLRALFLILFAAVSLTSCDKEEYFQSDDGIKDQLQGTWNWIAIPRTDPPEVWTFTDNAVTRTKNSVDDKGTFTIHTTWFKAEIKVSGFSDAAFNGTWQIVQLDKSILIIANDHDGATGIIEKEFLKAN
jgi:hypothetical protein